MVNMRKPLTNPRYSYKVVTRPLFGEKFQNCKVVIMAHRNLFEGLEPYKLASSKVHMTAQVLGQGAYATIYEIKYMGLKCAGKKIHNELVMDENITYTVQRFEEECKLLSQIQHPNIVQFLGVHFLEGDTKVPILAMEFLPLDLTKCIEQHKILPQQITYSILHDVALGLYYLHSHIPNPIIHRDLSSNNVLLTTHMTAKISDLGMARIVSMSCRAKHMTKTPGTPDFMPPETMGKNPKYGLGVDTFSYGVVMLHILSGTWPEPSEDKTVSEAERRSHLLQQIGRDHPLMELTLKCIQNDPKGRATAKEIVSTVAKVVPNSLENQLEMLHRMSDNKKKRDMLEHQKKMNEFEIDKLSGALQLLNRIIEDRQKELMKHRALQYEVDDCKKINENIRSEISTMESKIKKQAVRLHKTQMFLQDAQKDITEFGMLDEQSDTLQLHFQITFPSPLSPPPLAKQKESDGSNKIDYHSHCTDIMTFDQERSTVPKISSEQFSRVQRIGIGHTSIVWKGVFNKITSVAIKQLKPGMVIPSQFLKQAMIMNHLCHSNVLKLCAIHTNELEGVYIITELMESNLFQYLRQKAQSLQFSMLITMSLQVASGMAYLQREKCIHRDLAARNIFVGDGLTCKIAGFSLAEIVVQGDIVRADSNFKFPIKWTACETFKSYPHESTSKSDVWSYGILLWEIITYGSLPYPTMTNAQVQKEIINGYRMPCPSRSPDNLYSIMLQCWREDPAERPSFQILHHQLQQLSTTKEISDSFYTSRPLSIQKIKETAIYECITDSEEKIIDFKSDQEYETIFMKANFGSEARKQQIIELTKKLPSLGNHQYISTYEGHWNKTMPVVVKAYNWTDSSTPYTLQHAIEMSKFNHPKIVNFYAAVQSGKLLYSITERMNVDLSTFLQREDNSIQPHQLVNIVMQVAEGMAYLEKKKCILRNLKASSIVIGDKLMCKICDFDLAQIADGIHFADPKSSIPLRWTAPEAISHCMFSTKSDVWSFGILLWETITHGQLPYPEMTDSQVREHLHDGYHMPQPSKCPDNLYSIMVNCWKMNLDDRPTFVVLHESLKYYFQELNLEITDDLHQLLSLSFQEDNANLNTDSTEYAHLLQHHVKNPIYQANFDYAAQVDNEVSFKMNDLMEVQNVHTDWCWGKCKRSDEEGYIPSSALPRMPLISFSRNFGKDVNTCGSSLWSGFWKQNGSDPVMIEVGNIEAYTKDIIALHHPHIVKIHAAYAPEYIIMEPMNYGRLTDMLRNERSSLYLPHFIAISTQVAEGMAYLEERKCIHRQLAATNILVNQIGDNLICKISNFSEAKLVTDVNVLSAHGAYIWAEANIPIYVDEGYKKLAVRWAAPETLRDRKFSSRSDLWSYGALLFEIVTYGGIPYPDKTDREVQTKVLNGDPIPKPDNCPEKLYSLMLQCWKFELVARPSFSSLLTRLQDYYN